MEKSVGHKKLMRMHWFDWINYILLAVLVLMMVYPMWYVLVGAFSDGQDYSYGGVWLWPRMWSLTSFKVVLLDERLWIGLRNTVGRTVLNTVFSLIFTSAVAYGMSRTDLPAKKFFQIANVFTMFFSGGFIPYYLIITLLGFYDTFWVYIIPNIYSVSNMIIISTFFKNVPEELHEAALLDGASEIRIWLTIYMPLSVPILATVGLWLAVGNWNSYFNTMVFTRDSNLITLQNEIRVSRFLESDVKKGAFVSSWSRNMIAIAKDGAYSDIAGVEEEFPRAVCYQLGADVTTDSFAASLPSTLHVVTDKGEKYVLTGKWVTNWFSADYEGNYIFRFEWDDGILPENIADNTRLLEVVVTVARAEDLPGGGCASSARVGDAWLGAAALLPALYRMRKKRI